MSSSRSSANKMMGSLSIKTHGATLSWKAALLHGVFSYVHFRQRRADLIQKCPNICPTPGHLARRWRRHFDEIGALPCSHGPDCRAGSVLERHYRWRIRAKAGGRRYGKEAGAMDGP